MGVEQTGQVIGYALNRTNDSFKRIATIASTFSSRDGARVRARDHAPVGHVRQQLPGPERDARHRTPATGKFVVTNMYARPGGMDNFNNEGFAIAPQAECVNGLKPTFYAEDSDANRHTLRGGTINCTPLPPVVVDPTPTADAAAGHADADADPDAAAGGTAPRRRSSSPSRSPRPARTPCARRASSPSSITLGERADLTISATARKNAKAKARTILKATTRKGVAAGKPTIKLSLTSKVRKALRKGETLTLTVVARDAAGNATTTKISAKVK